MRAIGKRIAVAARDGSSISARASAQIAASGAISVRAPPRRALARCGSRARRVTREAGRISIRVDPRQRRRFGPRADRASRAIAAASPATRISTPSASLSTSPERPSSRARRQTAGRKPTPCTRPRTRISMATAGFAQAAGWRSGHGASLHSSTRLLPKSAIAATSPATAMPIGPAQAVARRRLPAIVALAAKSRAGRRADRPPRPCQDARHSRAGANSRCRRRRDRVAVAAQP